MTLLTQYYVPGLHIEDRSIRVPLDWAGHTPGEGFDGESISLFYRVVTAPEHVHDDLPLLVFLQGGPGGAGPRLLNPTSDGWIEEAIKHFRVVLPDQRGTGRSNRIDTHTMARLAPGGAEAQAAYLKRFLADSIIRDFEHLRRTEFAGARWVTLGQSYGGFLTLTYLSLFPEGVIASFTTGGIPHVPADATEVYEHTFPRMAVKTRQYYDRYPQDVERVAAVADRLAAQDVRLPNGDRLTVERFQTLGSDFGMKPSFERVHWIMDDAFLDGDGAVSADSPLSDDFLGKVMAATGSRPLYWPLQEFIYANGELDEPIRWAAQRVRDPASRIRGGPAADAVHRRGDVPVDVRAAGRVASVPGRDGCADGGYALRTHLRRRPAGPQRGAAAGGRVLRRHVRGLGAPAGYAEPGRALALLGDQRVRTRWAARVRGVPPPV